MTSKIPSCDECYQISTDALIDKYYKKPVTMKKYIVLFVVDDVTFCARTQAERMEDATYTIEGNLTALKVRDEILKVHDIDCPEAVHVYSLTEFMDAFNDEIINADHYFMSYVNAKTK
jgi:hypothetical protein